MIVKLTFFILALTAVQDASSRQYNLKDFLNGHVNTKANSKGLMREDCEENGHTCLDCDTSRYCFELPNGDWIVDEEDCDKSGLTCLESTGRCTSDANPQCDEAVLNYKFVCYQIGFFPHAFDCKKYHLCLANSGGTVIPDPTIFTCPEGFQYDSLSTLCNKKLDSKCKSIAGTCNRVGDSGPIKNNPNMYYTCLNTVVGDESYLIPNFFNCLAGGNYINGECRDPTPPSVPVDNDGKCTKSGSYYDPDECRNYFDCYIGEEPEPKSCSNGDYFDGLKPGCKPFVCVNK